MANVISEQAFLDLLTELQQHANTMVMTSYHDESELININLDTREINLKDSPYKDFLSVNKEHYAETLYFKVPRYYDGVDLMEMALAIEYVNAKGDSYISPVIVRDIHSCPGYIIFGWCIHGNATVAAGTLNFAIHFFSVDVTNHRIIYSLRTKPAAGKILYGIQTQGSKTEQGLINNYSLDEVISLLNNNSTIWWHNL